MKYYRLIGFAVASVLSLGGFAVLTSAEEVKLNRDFKIQIVSGDSSVLEGVGLEALIKTGKSSFEKVVLSKDSVDFEPTKYDMYQYVGEDVLENREVYRGIQNPTIVETDDYLMVASITEGFPYTTDVPTLKLNIKNRETGSVSKFEPVLDVTVSEFVNYQVLHEDNGTYYYAALTRAMIGDKNRIIIYTINPKTGELKKEHELEIENMWTLNMVANKLVTKSYSETEGDKLILLDLNSKEVEIIKTSDHDGIDYLGGFYESNDQLYIEAKGKMYPFDLETLTFSKAVGIEPTDSGVDRGYGLSNFLVKNNKMYVLYDVFEEGSARYQLLVVSDIKTGEVLFEGEIVQRADQGMFGSFELVEVK